MMKSALLFTFCALNVVSAWKSVTPLPSKRSDTGCSVNGDLIYVTGGCASDQVYESLYSACDSLSKTLFVYDIKEDKWDTLESMPRSRNRHSSVSVNNKIYIFGGVDENDNIIPYVDVYDIASGKWSTLAKNFDAATTDATAFVIEKKIIITGGYGIDVNHTYSSISKTHFFDIPTEQFEYNAAELNFARGDLCAGVIDGRAYVYGGYGSDFCNPGNYMEEFNPTSRQWAKKTGNNIPNDVTGGTKGDQGCFVMGKTLYTVGGEEKTQSCYSEALYDADSYYPAEDKWAVEKDIYLLNPRFRFCLVTWRNKVFRIGGQGPLTGEGEEIGHSILAEVESYTFDGYDFATHIAPLSLLLTLALSFALFF